jgi:hypothetical protein
LPGLAAIQAASDTTGWIFHAFRRAVHSHLGDAGELFRFGPAEVSLDNFNGECSGRARLQYAESIGQFYR